MDYIASTDLDEIAALLLKVSTTTRDERGRLVVPAPVDKTLLPDAVKAALDVLLGEGRWTPLTIWPKPGAK